MQTLWQDLCFGARMLWKTPGFTLIAVLTLALGIGANAAMFSVVNAVLLSPLPFHDSDRLVRLRSTQTLANGQQLQASLSPLLLHAVRERSRLIERSAAQRFLNLTLTGEGEPERLIGIGVSDGWLETLGVSPLVGRGFDAREQTNGSGSRVATISYGFWQRRFGGQRDVIGRAVRLNEQSYTVIGVMPPQFRYPYNAEVWLPMTFAPTAARPADLNVSARVRPGVTAAQLNAELQAIAAQLARETTEQQNSGLLAQPFSEEFRRDPNHSIAALLFAVGFVLLIACVNVANLQLARSHTRQREMAVRSALGASRGRLLRQLLTESLWLAALSGVAGVALAYGASRWLTALIPARLGEVLQHVQVDARVLAFSALVCLLTGVLFGLVPALRLADDSPVTVLKAGGRAGRSGSQWLRGLVAAEVALAFVLLVGAGLMMQNFVRLLRADAGYDAANLLKLNLGLPAPTYNDPLRRAATLRQLVQKLEAVPGVAAAAATSLQPIPRSATNTVTPLTLETQTDATERPPVVNLRMVTPSYFRTLGLRVVRGRAFSEQDTENSAPVILVNEAAARRFWPNQDPTNRIAKPGRRADESVPWHNVVGVVSDIAEPDARMPETIYQVYAQGTASQPTGVWSSTSVTLLVRAKTESSALLLQIRRAVAEVDGTLPLYDVAALETALAEPLGDQRLGATLFVSFGAFGLLLAALGTYGVIAFSVAQRTQEFGIRLALGAQPADLLRLVLREGLRVIGGGLLLGSAAAAWLSRLLANSLSAINAHDPLTYVAVAAILLLSGLWACWVPARRATKVDPLRALRVE